MKELTQIQNELKAPKNQYNKFGGYKYRNCEDILEAVKPLLLKYNCNLFIYDDAIQIGDRYYIKATAQFYNDSNNTSVSALAREPLNKKGMDESQITGATSSYARKYALNGLFLIDDTKDSDTEEHKQQTQNKSDETKKAILKDVPKCNSMYEMTMLWESYPEYHNDSEIKTAFGKHKKELLTKNK